MPLYDYKCKNGHEFEFTASVNDCLVKQPCPECIEPGERILKHRQSGPNWSDKIYPYYDKSLNRVFNSSGERNKYLKSNGLVESGKGSMTRKQEKKLIKEWRLFNEKARGLKHAKGYNKQAFK